MLKLMQMWIILIGVIAIVIIIIVGKLEAMSASHYRRTMKLGQCRIWLIVNDDFLFEQT